MTRQHKKHDHHATLAEAFFISQLLLPLFLSIEIFGFSKTIKGVILDCRNNIFLSVNFFRFLDIKNLGRADFSPLWLIQSSVLKPALQHLDNPKIKM